MLRTWVTAALLIRAKAHLGSADAGQAGEFMRRFPLLVSSAVTAAAMCGALFSPAAAAAAAASSSASPGVAATSVTGGGTWGYAETVSGTGQYPVSSSASCASPGNCAAGGYGFVVNETDGSWGTAHPVVAVAPLSGASAPARVSSVSCASPGNCVAGGSYSDASGYNQAFVADETNGVWAAPLRPAAPGSITRRPHDWRSALV